MRTDELTAGPPLTAQDAVVTVRDHRAGVRDLLRATWEARALVPLVGSRVLIKGYAGTKLGRAWLVLRPGVTVLSMTLLFGAVLNAPSNGVPYPMFLLTGLLAWLTFDRFVFWAVRSFDVYGRLIRNFAFPLLLVPTASGFAASVEFTIFVSFILIATGVFWIIDGVIYLQFGPELLLAPAGVLLCVCVAWSIGLWLAPLNARWRDVRILTRYVLMLWMYVTPVLYPISALPGWLDFLAVLNPVTAPVELVKEGLIGAGDLHTGALAVTLVTIVVVGGGGLWFFSVSAPGAVRRVAEFSGEDDEEL
jgi:lipopolysaccharide transport system permease protein